MNKPDTTTKVGGHLHLISSPTSHEELEWAHNRLEHARHDHVHGREWDSAKPEDTVEPWSDYDLAVMPRGV